MKHLHLLCFFVFLLLYNCKTTRDSIGPFFTKEHFKAIVGHLAADSLMGRNTGTEAIARAAEFIENTFRDYGVKPYYKTYRDSFNINTLNAFNIIGVVAGTDPELKNETIILGAHYDHIGTLNAVNGDSIANGANDNASGTAMVLGLAKYFTAAKNNKRTIVFVLFSGEEMGLKGSKHLAKRLKSENINLYTMLNFEMLGVPFVNRDYDMFLTGFETSNMAEKLNSYTASKRIGKSNISIEYQLFKRSDNYPFYTEFQVPSQTLSSCDLTNFDYYHHVDDEVDKLDFEFMTHILNVLAPAIETMSNTKEKEITLTHG